MTFEQVPDYSGFQGGSIGKAYNEAAFRYFLDVDRARAERSKRSIILVLVSMRPDAGRSAALNDTSAALLFGGLAASVREVDFLGWYRQGRVIGAVLPQAATPGPDRQLIAHRIVTSLRKSLPHNVARFLHVRLVSLGGKFQR